MSITEQHTPTKQPAVVERRRDGTFSLSTLALPLAIALSALLLATIAHAWLTHRFGMGNSQALEIFSARLADVPVTIGKWEGTDTAVQQKQLQRAQVVGHLSRSYRHRDTGAMVNMFLVCGTSRHLTLHTPASCYPAAGFEQQGRLQTDTVDVNLEQPVEFARGEFEKDSGGRLERLEILWSFSTDGRWRGPLSRERRATPAMYKIYIISPAIAPQENGSSDSSSMAFAKDAMPVLHSVLFPNATGRDPM